MKKFPLPSRAHALSGAAVRAGMLWLSLLFMALLAACNPGTPVHVGPVVESTVPADNANDVELDIVLEARVSRNLDASTVNGSTIWLYEVETGSEVAGSVVSSRDDNGSVIRLVPSEPLAPNTEYGFLMTGGVADTTGASLKEALVRFTTGEQDRPRIASSTPAAGETNVFRDTSINTRFSILPAPDDKGSAGVEGTTVNQDNVILRRAADGAQVAGVLTISGGRDSIIFQPHVPLDPNTEYEFEVRDSVTDIVGRSFEPYSITFTTGTDLAVALEPITFERETVYEGEAIASVAIGPDKRLYATTLAGNVIRWDIAEGGGLDSASREEFALPGRSLIGIAFEPSDPDVIWVTHNDPLPDTTKDEIAADWTGGVARIEMRDGSLENATRRDVIEGLPRSVLDHMTNSLAFGPDGGLYLLQGSNSSNGAADPSWGMRPERLLSAAVLRLDVEQAMSGSLPIDVRTDEAGDYDPYAPGAPLTIHAEGLRNAYDLLWHTNGNLYVPANGGNGGNTPGSPDGSVPALEGVGTQPDFLHHVEEGKYYGHPNPLRGNYVLNAGNPSADYDRADRVAPSGELAGYPLGTQPEPDYGGYVVAFYNNASANGIIQYRSANALLDKLLIVQYTMSNIVAVDLESYEEEPFTQVISGLQNPVDLIEDFETGNLYVAENYWGKSGAIKLFKVVEDD